jgi:hypothetical protein
MILEYEIGAKGSKEGSLPVVATYLRKWDTAGWYTRASATILKVYRCEIYGILEDG